MANTTVPPAKGAVFYRGSWLMPGSRSLELYDLWKKNPNQRQIKSGPPTPKTMLDELCERLDREFDKMNGR